MAFVSKRSFDNSEYMLRALGALWSYWYPERDNVKSLLTARGEPFYQAYIDLLDLVASKCRFNIPIFKRQQWYLFTVLESQRETSFQLMNLYGTSGLVYQNASKPAYGDKENTKYYSFALGTEIKQVHAVYNRVINPSLIWMNNEDFYIDSNRGVISFAVDPFQDPLVPKRDVLDSDGNVVDREQFQQAWRDRQNLIARGEQGPYAPRLMTGIADRARTALASREATEKFAGRVAGDSQAAMNAVPVVPSMAQYQAMGPGVAGPNSMGAMLNRAAAAPVQMPAGQFLDQSLVVPVGVPGMYAPNPLAVAGATPMQVNIGRVGLGTPSAYLPKPKAPKNPITGIVSAPPELAHSPMVTPGIGAPPIPTLRPPQRRPARPATASRRRSGNR